jgi:hypothetical protein
VQQRVAYEYESPQHESHAPHSVEGCCKSMYFLSTPDNQAIKIISIFGFKIIPGPSRSFFINFYFCDGQNLESLLQHIARGMVSSEEALIFNLG